MFFVLVLKIFKSGIRRTIYCLKNKVIAAKPILDHIYKTGHNWNIFVERNVINKLYVLFRFKKVF